MITRTHRESPLVPLCHTHMDTGPYRGPVSVCGVRVGESDSQHGGAPVSEPRRRIGSSTFTAEELEGFRQRMAAWSDANPWKAILAERLARLGGPHRPSDVADDRYVMTGEVLIEPKREASLLREEVACPF